MSKKSKGLAHIVRSLLSCDVNLYVIAGYIKVQQLQQLLELKRARPLHTIVAVLVTCGYLVTPDESKPLYRWNRVLTEDIVPEHTGWFKVGLKLRCFPRIITGIRVSVAKFLRVMQAIPAEFRKVKDMHQRLPRIPYRRLIDILNIVSAVHLMERKGQRYKYVASKSIDVQTPTSDILDGTSVIRTRGQTIWSSMQDFEFDKDKIIF